MTINLKIEVLKVFTLEFSLSSNTKKKEEEIAKKESDSKPAASK